MNLYQLHKGKLRNYDKRHVAHVKVAYEMIENNEITDPRQKKEVESLIMKDPRYAYLYAYDIIQGRWPEAESYIMKNPRYAYWYACDVIQGRWPEAEPYIMKNPEYAYLYTIDVLQHRWPEAEPYIMKDDRETWKRYKEIFSISQS